MLEYFSTKELNIPQLLDPEHGQILFDGLLSNIGEAGQSQPSHMQQTDIATVAQNVLNQHAEFFKWVVANSSYLTRLLRFNPALIAALGSQTWQALLSNLMATTRAEAAAQEDRADVMRVLRQAKGRAALLIALGDLSENWNLAEVTGALTQFADLTVELSLRWLFDAAYRDGTLIGDVDLKNSGLIVLAMGKHGGHELNYSSDIDLVLFYEPGRLHFSGDLEANKFFNDVARDMSIILQRQTDDGYVFRVDLRLRPDPASTPAALSVGAALTYYEGQGQNWERAAFIKARAIAADIQAGEAFLEELRPFIWRRNLDFASIEDVHSMKRQIHAVRGHGTIATTGHNIKLGRGGIREIEFFVQTQQLIAGGRDDGLRGIQTVPMLAQLASRGWINEDTASGLSKSYAYLRGLEHRLQMRLDEQTHTLPRDEAGMAAFANFSGYASVSDLTEILSQTLSYVSQEYSNLFENADSLSASEGNLVFAGSEHDPDTLETLTKMGFKRPETISDLVRSWHRGRMRATRSARSREILTRLIPTLLGRISMTRQPDETFVQFDKFLSGLPSGVQLFSLFQAQPKVLDLVLDVIGTAPRLADWLSRNVSLLDIMLDQADILELMDINVVYQTMERQFSQIEPDDEDIIGRLDRLRIFTHERQFSIGVRQLTEPMEALDCTKVFTNLAENAVQDALDAALKDVGRQYGTIEGGKICVLGLGKLGSAEMSLSSDLDIIIICDAPNFLANSDGEKPIDADTWFARAARRFLSGLTSQTAQGGLYDVDTRLRPSGNAGPLVVKLSGFDNYQHNEAWTWEHMALTRARVVAGDPELSQQVEDVVRDVLLKPRDRSQLMADAADMRNKLAEHRQSKSDWDIKMARGGLFDLEFIVQILQLEYAPLDDQILNVRNDQVLKNFAELDVLPPSFQSGKVLSTDDFHKLLDIWREFSLLRLMLSLCVDPSEREDLPLATQNLLLRATNQPDIKRLKAHLDDLRLFVADRLDAILSL
jgi:glutamate-ammonia-ligase adenylyltransferase